MIKKTNSAKFTYKKLVLALGLSSTAGWGALAQAQSQDKAESLNSIEEIVVTAQRRSQSLQDVPVTVTAFGAQQIKDARMQRVDDIAVRTPGLSFDAFPAAQPRLAIRGIGSSDRGAAGDPSSAVFVDEIYMGRPATIAFDAFDVERIEVLKGPQGTLYGRNVVGGAINVITASPHTDEFDASVEATYGNYNRVETAGYVNIPLGDGIGAVRASGSVRQHDGYTDNRNTGGELDDQDTRNARLQALLMPTEDVEIKLGFDTARDRAAGPGQHAVDVDPDDPLSTFWTVNRDRDYNESEIDGYEDRDTWGFRGQLIWDLPFATINYLTSYRELDYDVYYDFDGGNPSFNAISIAGGNKEESELYSQELRFSSPDTSELDWVIGFYQYKADTTRDDILDLSLGGPTGREVFHQHAELESLAVYGDMTAPVTEKLNVTAGVRYTEDEKTFALDTTESNSFFRAEGAYATKTSDTWNAVTWRLGADYHFDDSNMVYAMVSKGFKSGGFQDTPDNAADALTPFDPEYALQYEIGQKSDFFNRHLVWNNTIYYMDYTDLQTRQVVGLSARTDNAGSATIKGYETDLTWQTDGGFRLGLTYAYTDAVFDEFVEDGNNYSGNTISRTPKHKVVVSPSYVFSLDSGAEITLAADYQYASKIYDDNSNEGPEQRDPTNFVDARIIYTSTSQMWTVSAWGKNLTDELTRTHQATFLGGTFASYNPPRTYGVTVRWDY